MASTASNRQIQDGVGSKPRKPEPYYSYTPLPKGWIRLLEIQHVSDNAKLDFLDLEKEMHVTMHAFSLSECPEYTALSYTWGEPHSTKDPTYRMFTQEPRCFPVLCEDRILRCTRNLSVALRRLRLGQHYCKYPPTRDEQQEAGIREYFWVDALCIDQDDLAERAAQVAVMGQIYSQAAVCTIWLGEADECSGVGLQLAANILNNWELETLGRRGETTKFREMVNALIDGLSDHQANALAALLSRTWFSRVWILQEVVLAKSLVAMLGPLVLDFEALLSLGTAMIVGDSSQLLLVKPGFRKVLMTQPNEAVRSITNTPALLAALNGIRRGMEKGIMPDILAVMRMSCDSEATDARDKIYGILAITKEFDVRSQIAIQADYSLPVSTVYSRTTSAIASRRNDLHFLSLVWDSGLRTVENLPSWCPGYSFPPSGFADVRYSNNKSLWTSLPKIEILNDRLLVVDRFMYDAVSRVHVAKDSRVQMRYVPGAEAVLGLLRLALSIERKNKHRSIHVAKMAPTRVESLWRMLIRDEFNGDQPAPAAAGLYFPLMLMTMFGDVYSKEDVPQFEISPPTLSVNWTMTNLKALHGVVTKLCRLEPQSRAFLPDTKTMIAIFKRETLENENLSLDAVQAAFTKTVAPAIEALPRRAREVGLEQEFLKLLDPDSAGFTSLEQLVLRISALFGTTMMTNIFKSMSRKRFFATRRTELLGAGHGSIMEGDEIWMLHGADAPAVLRPLDDGRYQFCGDVYIYGIQDADLLDVRSKEGVMKRITIE